MPVGESRRGAVHGGRGHAVLVVPGEAVAPPAREVAVVPVAIPWMLVEDNFAASLNGTPCKFNDVYRVVITN